MKRIILFSIVIVLVCLSAHSQIDRPGVIKKKTEQTQTKTTPASTQVVEPVYSLAAVRVSIKTGSDNKEFPSEIFVGVAPKGNVYLFEQPGSNMKNEMKVNSTTEFGLQKSPGVDAQSYTLQSIQTKGIELRIVYNPNIFADAWKIEGISMTLEFRDQNGNLHPSMGNKTIIFNNASGFLNFTYRTMLCTADGNFAPLTSSIRDRY